MRETLCSLILLLCSSFCFSQVQKGSLVVYLISKKSDYVAIGAESRATKIFHGRRQADDSSCKFITLGGNTLFFNTGNASIQAYHGDSWDSLAVARTVYRRSPENNAVSLIEAWNTNAITWFGTQKLQNLKTVVEPGGSLVTGGFINFDKVGRLFIQSETLFFDPKTQGILARPGTAGPGDAGFAGVAGQLMREFFTGETPRVLEARRQKADEASDPHEDVETVKQAIRFAEKYGEPEEREQLGGPIDAAILYRNGKIEWVSRKTGCYQADVRTNATRSSLAK